MSLRNGDRIFAEIIRGTETEIELRWRGNLPMTVPRDFISDISVPPVEVEMLAEDFERPADPARFVDPKVWSRLIFDDQRSASGKQSCRLTAESGPLTLSLSQPLDAARIQFWFRIDEAAAVRGLNGPVTHVSFDFESAATNELESWHLEIGSDRTRLLVPSGTGSPEGTQSAETDAGWHCVTAILSPQRILFLFDDAFLRSGRRAPGRLRAIRFATGTTCWIDDLLVSQVRGMPADTQKPPTATEDSVTMPTGDQWFGQVRKLSRDGVLFAGLGQDRQINWPDVTRVEFRQSDRAVQGREPSPAGLVAVIEFQSCVDRPLAESDRLAATITDATADTLSAWHPAFGTFLIAWKDVARIEPRFIGSTYQLDARQMHLGDAIREDFHRPIPDGTEWAGEFELPAKPNGEAWLSLSVSDLEPSGPDAPPGSPFLKELRAGQLLTELTINDRPVSDLNRWLRFRAPPDRPERVRIRVPLDLIQAGRNTFRLNQRPRQADGKGYDNCELSNLRLEFVESPAGQPP